MSPSSSTRRQCDLPTGGSFPVTSGLDEQQCRKAEGTVVGGDGGSFRDAPPVSTFLLDSSLAGDVWSTPRVPDGSWTNARSAERLVLHPICVLRRRLPAAAFLAELHRVNEEFGMSLVAVLRDDDTLRDAMVELVLTISSIAASIADADDGDTDPSAAAVPEGLLESARDVVHEIDRRTDDDALREALHRLLDLGAELAGTRLGDMGDALTRAGAESQSDGVGTDC